MKNSDFPSVQSVMDDLTGKSSLKGESAHPPSEQGTGEARSLGRLVRVRLSLTQEEVRALQGIARDAANEPGDVDHQALLSLCRKVETATAHLNAEISGRAASAPKL